MMQKLLTALVMAAAVVGGMWLMRSSSQAMPEVTFTTTDGRTIDSRSLRGRSVLVNFWSVSCEICLRDMPHLTRIQSSLGDEKFEIIGVALPNDPPPAVMSVTQKLAPGYPIALDVHGEINSAFGGVDVTPTSFLVDPEGNIRLKTRGPIDEARLRATLLTFGG